MNHLCDDLGGCLCTFPLPWEFENGPPLLINIKSDGTPEISQLRYFSWGHPGGCLVGSLDGFEVIETGEANDSRDM